VSGWTMQYIFSSVCGHIHGTPESFAADFAAFSTHPIKPIVWATLLIGITHYVIVHGVQDGIEKASKLMMPVLFILLIILVACSLTLPGAWKGVEFLLKPDFSKVTGKTFLEALGQSFFSLSIGMGCLCTYASYFRKETRLLSSAVQIAAIDTVVAVLAGLIIFPAALSVGIEPDSGPSLIFITLPNVFERAFGNMPVIEYVVSIMFYLLLAIAALTSFISIHEVGTSFLGEELRIGRRKAARLVSLYAVVMGAVCSLSLGKWDWCAPFGMTLFDFLDWFTANCCLPVGAFFTCLFIGWYVDHRLVRNEFTNYDTTSQRYVRLFVVMVKYICPLFIVCVFLHQLGWL